jgi:hypothetical protein
MGQEICECHRDIAAGDPEREKKDQKKNRMGFVRAPKIKVLTHASILFDGPKF